MLVQSWQIPIHDLLFQLMQNDKMLSVLMLKISEYNELDCHGKRVRHNEKDMTSYRERFKTALLNNTNIQELDIYIGVHHSNDEQFLTRGRMAELEMIAESIKLSKSKINSVSVRHCNTLSQFMTPITKMCVVDTVDKVDLMGGISNNLCSRLGRAICHERMVPLEELSVGMSDSGLKDFLHCFMDVGKQGMLPKKLLCGDYIGNIGPLQSAIIAPPISALVQSENCIIVKLELCGEIIDSDIFFSSFAAVLPKNKSIQKLILRNTPISDAGWTALLEGIRGHSKCIQSTFNSNHTLFQVVGNPGDRGGSSKKWEEIASPYLGINSRDNKKETRRLKIIRFHFPGGHNVEFLNSTHHHSCIRAGVHIKNAIEHSQGTTRKDMEKNAYSFFYHFMRHNPTLADNVVYTNKKKNTRSKRKRLG